MPFNKGDFTQQGVNGHVNATVRLNEKRQVNIDLTSNEEAEGCTITGTVKDLLNDKVYPIGAGVSGNIEITENTAEGETLNIAPYATATVNVSGGGGSDIPMCTVKVVSAMAAQSTLMCFNENPSLFKTYPLVIQGENIFKMFYFDEDGITLYGLEFREGAVFEFSDPVNIDLTDDWPFIIDETRDSSLTVTVTNWGGIIN